MITGAAQMDGAILVVAGTDGPMAVSYTHLRVKTYEAIVKGDPVPKAGVPESFKVLFKELQSLGLDIKVLDADKNEIDLRQTYEDVYKRQVLQPVHR